MCVEVGDQVQPRLSSDQSSSHSASISAINSRLACSRSTSAASVGWPTSFPGLDGFFY
jgi:hypothetical protein